MRILLANHISIKIELKDSILKYDIKCVLRFVDVNSEIHSFSHCFQVPIRINNRMCHSLHTHCFENIKGFKDKPKSLTDT